jgi:acyl-coenzyme A synthetase/AMP-(fatty) acid ligase
MRFPVRPLPLVTVVAATVATLVVSSAAGPDKIKFPANWKEHVLYTVVDRHDTKQYRELYASTPAAVDAMKAGKALPDGTVLTLVQYKAQVDAAGAPVKEIYGCTEAGMVASRRTTEGAAWRLLPGVEMLQDEQGSRVRGGHVEIEALLSDVIERNTDGTFMLHGRTADLVNIAGKRTSLASLNHHLNAIPGVQDGVFLMPDDGDGAVTRPMAFVVTQDLSAEHILNALRNSVDAVFLPRPLYLVDALPRNATGKLTRESLLRLRQQCAKR